MVFVDSLPNDEILKGWFGEVDYSEQIMYEIMSTISAKSRLVVLGIELQSAFLGQTSETFLRRKDTALSCMGTFLDFSMLLRKFAPEHTYKDDAHPDERSAFAIGFAIGQSFEEICAIMPAKSKAKDYSSNFRIFDPRLAPQGMPIVDYKNSLFEYRFLKLLSGQSYEISSEIPENSRCIGFYINRWETHAHIGLANDQGSSRIVLRYEPRPGQFEINFYPIKNGYPLKQIKVLDREYVYVPGPNWTGEKSEIPADPQLYLGEMLFWMGEPVYRPQSAFKYMSNRVQSTVADSVQRFFDASAGKV